MKKLFLLLIAANGMLSATAQMKDSTIRKKQYLSDAEMKKWAIDINLLGGVLTQDLTTVNSIGSYQNALGDANLGKLKFTNGTSFGFDAQLGYFFGNSNHFGIGGGIMYLSQMGDVTLDQFHVQFQSTDGLNNTSREVITANQPVKESLQITNINVPIVLKYKDRFSKHFGIAIDAGILYNVQLKNAYKTNASFDYEEIVQNVTTEGGGKVTIYDNSLIPASTDLTITKNWFNNTTHANETIDQYFATQKGLGYNVGLAQTPNNKSGNVSYTTGSIGFLIQPSLNYYLSDNVAINLGGYYIYQAVSNVPTNTYRLTDKPGDYSSVLNSVSKSVNQSYGVNLGVRFLFGKEGKKQKITAEDVVDPSVCGLTDGSITLHGLKPDKAVTVNYTVDSTKPGEFTGTADATGALKVPKLGAGAYTGIAATIGKRHLDGYPVKLTDPAMNISVFSTNPTTSEGCDGTITISGVKSGQKVTVNYRLNGVAKPEYGATVASNNTVKLTGLCAGTYSQIVVAMNTCTASAPDITLTAPPPPPPPPPPPAPPALPDISRPILFEVGKTKIHPSSFEVLEKAVIAAGKFDRLYIVVEGHTDNTGTDAINDKLSFKRAEAVKKYLIRKGIDGSRIVAIGHGSHMPVATNDTPEGRAMNRRVVMTLKDRSSSKDQ